MLHDNYLAFKEVADSKSFSKAAAKLFLSQPAITMKIKSLEDYYGTKLFDRAKNIQLTEPGEILYDYVANCLNCHKRVFEAISSATGTIKGTLHLGATLTIGEYMLPRIIGNFIKQHPEVECNLEIANTEVIAQKLLAGDIDLGFIEGPIVHSQLVKEDFLKDELVLVVPHYHPWAGLSEISAEELVRERLILRETGSGTRAVFEKKMHERNLDGKMQLAMELGSTQAIKEAVLAGLGVTVISGCTVQREVAAGLLNTLRIIDMPMHRDLNIYYYKYHFKTRLTDALLSDVKDGRVKQMLDLPLD